MSLKIVHYGDPVLRRKGERITKFDPALAKLAAEMVATMHEAAGIGLAAQQIGLAIQLCVVDLRRTEAEFDWEFDGAHLPLEVFMPITIVNPSITVARGTPEDVYEEGCLSFPNIRGDVIRPEVITVNFQDERGNPHVLKCNGLLARCVQHEADHLNGVLFIDRMEKKIRAGIEAEIKTLSKATRADAKA